MLQDNVPIFRNLNAEDHEAEVTEIESLCMQCHENGTTRLLLTKIPFYKEVVIMSFNCDNCGWQNNELQPAATIQTTGIRFTLNVSTKTDMNREVVQTGTASVSIPELEFEIPAKSQEGSITTVEGILDRAIQGLEASVKHITDEDVSNKMTEFVDKMKSLRKLERSFRIVIDDPSGNSFVENPRAPSADDAMTVERYTRSKEQNLLLGMDEEATEEEDVTSEVLTFSTNCSECGAPCETRMKTIKVPYFKEVIIIATTCDRCGHRTNEVKSGSGIEPLGERLELDLTETCDLARDVLKSETCTVSVPELELEVGAGLLGGRFTTVEGLLDEIRRQITQENPFFRGDTVSSQQKVRMGAFVDQLGKVIEGKMPATLILDDPFGNSYIQNLYAPEPDPALRSTKYERSYEQNEAMGLNDIKTENYEEDS
ncbi:zinc finger protein ZPR1-like [Ornithodoros turicata]|uniref:zinc finger protein ZPR1-like n=1 Tax=Ornithodoros turicata TaxID=34597 RepID=UPI0031392513